MATTTKYWICFQDATQDFLTPQDFGGLSSHGAWQSQASPLLPEFVCL